MRSETLEILEPGLLTTVQDGGRRGFEADGVPRSGAADPIGLAVANLLVGNAPSAAAIECTLLGPRLRVLVETTIGLGGADLGAHLEGSGRELATAASHRLQPGDVVAFRGAVDEQDGGCRAYVALPNGVDVPAVLGSRSTCLPAGFGGLDGRALRIGDRLGSRDAPSVGRRAPSGGSGEELAPQQLTGRDLAARRLSAQLAAELPSPAQRIRVLPGPASSDEDETRGGIVGRPWIVGTESDRTGLRLEPADPGDKVAVALAPLAAGELPSHGVVPGAIQVTPSGQPLVLMPDAGTTGGYPVVAVVISADLALLGQLAPGDEVRFRAATLEQARAAELERRDWLDRVAQVVGRRNRVT